MSDQAQGFQRQAVLTMLTLQDRMNSKVHPEWVAQDFAWYRAAWIECGELMDHYGYKWWKKQTPDIEQVRLEIIDIWHFGMSAMFKDASTGEARDLESIADEIMAEAAAFAVQGLDVREATEALAQSCLATKGFVSADFMELMAAAELSFSDLFRHYVGKNVLNFFRQDNGYKDGSYIKLWQGREDNEHLVEVVAELDSAAEDFAELVYQGLESRYQTLTA